MLVGRQSRAQQGSWVSDSASMGAPAGGSYPMDVFYSMKNGVQKSDTNRSWHMAFEMTPFSQGTAVSILANYAQNGVKVYSLNKQASTSFTTLSAADTIGKTGEDRALYNGPRSWYYGALNRTAAAGNLFDYGWGMYDQFTNDLTGDSLFLLKVGNAAYKVWVQNYESGGAPLTPDSIGYTFRIASWDNAVDRTVVIRRGQGYTNRNFAYYNILTNTWRDREPATNSWDLVFTRYGDTAFAGALTAVYPVMGVLSNKGVQVAKVQGLSPDETTFAAQTYDLRTDKIGDDWKYTVGSGGGTSFALDSVSYFVKSKNTMEYYLLQFTRFDGLATGKSVFRKKLLGAVTSVENTSATATPFFALAPNPATTTANLMLDATEAASGTIVIADLSGRLVQRYPAQFAKGMNAFAISTATLPAGTYVVTAMGGAWKACAKLMVQH